MMWWWALRLWSCVALVSAESITNQEFVEGLYQSVLCRKGDAAGIAEKVASLKAEELTRAQMVMLVRFSEEYQSTSAYLAGGKPTGNTDDECGSCSACKAMNLNTECCPGPVKVPEGYDSSASAAEQAKFFHYAMDETCSDCVAAACKAWTELPAGTDGPAVCTTKAKLDCCHPTSSWGFYFVVVFALLTLLYIGAGTMYGQSTGGTGIETFPNFEFWKATGGLVQDGLSFTAGGFHKNKSSGYTPVTREAASALSPEEQAAATARQEALTKLQKKWEKAQSSGANKQNPGRSALIEAAMVGDHKKLESALKKAHKEKVLTQLIDAGDRRAFTAYHHAAANGHVDCVKLLLKGGADTSLPNDMGETGWVLATRAHRADVEEMLRKLAKKKDQNKKLFLETKLREAEKAHSSGDFGIGGLPAVDLPE